MTALILYTTTGCHLCELADTLLQTLARHHQLTIIATEIADDDELVQRYGLRIPVVQFPDNTDIGWPFDQHDIEKKLRQQ
ncbi:MAG: glutaredoxin [Methylophagaceae bacterium]|jgi:glutaredoxin